MMDIELAKHILRKGKALAPDRFPQPSLEVAQAWAGALGSPEFPPALWSESVDLWATTLVGDRMCTPKELFQAALVVRDRWDAVPEKKQVLDELRVARANSFYARNGLDPITAADLPQHAGRPPEALTARSGRQQSQPERIGAAGTFIRRSQQ
ncbi:hypothetical protein [Dietzia sp. NCCP-2495]|uniref:hypothetical protein n=1 Tax=Dietzia sp. NCCP-2495 TaxID=2934675 RepID=UPI0022324F6B|nr:hypothetical protein [Dietzia sp. NCCP-2495]